MKKLNMKKLNQFFLSGSNSDEVKSLVSNCVDNFVHSDTKNPQCIAVLNDLGLLMEG
jgi:hypothetical protein